MENKDFEVFIPKENYKREHFACEVHDKIINILMGTHIKSGCLVYNFNCRYDDPEVKDEILVSRTISFTETDEPIDSDDLYDENWITYGTCYRNGMDTRAATFDIRTTQILPIIKLSDEMFAEITKGLKYGTPTIKLGRYPKNDWFLTSADKKKRVYTGKTYTLPITEPSFTSAISKTQTVKEYELEGKKYIDIIRYKQRVTKTKPSKIEETYRVEPIMWHIDWERKCLIADEPLLTGIGHSKGEETPSYKNTYLYKYLNEIFLRDVLLQHLEIKKKPKEEDIEIDEITAILNEISVYSEFHHGQEDINEIVRKLIVKYNNDIIELKNNTGLTLVTEDTLRIGLISDLNRILDKLKRSSESNEEYNKILEFIDKCIAALDGKESECDSELYKDICKIHSEILPRLASDHDKQLDLRKRIIELFEQDKKRHKRILKIYNYIR